MKLKTCRACGVPKAPSEFRKGGFGPMRTWKACQRKAGHGGKCIQPQAKVVVR